MGGGRARPAHPGKAQAQWLSGHDPTRQVLEGLSWRRGDSRKGERARHRPVEADPEGQLGLGDLDLMEVPDGFVAAEEAAIRVVSAEGGGVGAAGNGGWP